MISKPSVQNFDGMASDINRSDSRPDHTPPPKIDISDFGKEALNSLLVSMKSIYQQYGIVVIRNVRQFNKNEADQKKWLGKINREDEVIECCAGTFATVIKSSEKSEFDSEGALINVQETIGAEDEGNVVVPLQISVMNAGEKFWTAGLNGPTAVVERLAKEAGIPLDKIVILNQTHEVEIDEENLRVMHDSILGGTLPSTVRITPANLYRDAANKRQGMSAETLHSEESAIIDKLVSIIAAMDEGRTENIDRHFAEIIITLDRNTLGLHRLSDLIDQGGAHPASNRFLGMEDTRSQAYKLLAVYRQSGEAGLRAFLHEHFKNVVSYKDERMDLVKNVDLETESDVQTRQKVLDQRKKIRDEISALVHQFDGRNESFQNEPVVPTRKRDFKM